MPSNKIKINNCEHLEWEVSDSKMEKVISVLDEVGFKIPNKNPKNMLEGNDDNLSNLESEGYHKNFEREELQALRIRAKYMAETEGLNIHWSRAYFKLMDACNCLDAIMARCEDKTVEGVI